MGWTKLNPKKAMKTTIAMPHVLRCQSGAAISGGGTAAADGGAMEVNRQLTDGGVYLAQRLMRYTLWGTQKEGSRTAYESCGSLARGARRGAVCGGSRHPRLRRTGGADHGNQWHGGGAAEHAAPVHRGQPRHVALGRRHPGAGEPLRGLGQPARRVAGCAEGLDPRRPVAVR